MGGPEGSIYPSLRVRPWLKVIWGDSEASEQAKRVRKKAKTGVFWSFLGLKTVQKTWKWFKNDLNSILYNPRVPKIAFYNQFLPLETEKKQNRVIFGQNICFEMPKKGKNWSFSGLEMVQNCSRVPNNHLELTICLPFRHRFTFINISLLENN